jgi:hypothetical protein
VLSREDFIFTIGYDGPAAVVDKQARKKFGKLSTGELAEKGFFRPAYSSAVYSGNKEEIQLVAEAYNRLGSHSADVSSISSISSMERIFGVSLVDVKRSILI